MKKINILSSKNEIFMVTVQLVFLFICFLTVVWLWDRWMLDGPHGPYRWVGMDFTSYWVGVREMFHRIDPYSPEATLKIQQAVYGGAALGEDPMLFSYPAWLFLLIAPFALLPYKWATVLWVGTLLWATFNLFYKIATMMGKNNFLAQSLWLIALVVGNLPFLIISVIKGQLGCLGLLALFFAYQMCKCRPLQAGIILAIALIKPTVTVVPVAAFLLQALLQKNWKFLTGFTGSMLVLSLGSYFAIGNWMPSYFEMLDMKIATPILWSMNMLSAPWNFLYATLFIGILIFSFYLSCKGNHTYWFPASILAGIALTPMRWIYDLFLGILILTERKEFSTMQSIFASLSIFSPWILILVPDEDMRWVVAVIGLPLIWAATWVAFSFSNVQEAIGKPESFLET